MIWSLSYAISVSLRPTFAHRSMWVVLPLREELFTCSLKIDRIGLMGRLTAALDGRLIVATPDCEPCARALRHGMRRTRATCPGGDDALWGSSRASVRPRDDRQLALAIRMLERLPHQGLRNRRGLRRRARV